MIRATIKLIEKDHGMDAMRRRLSTLRGAYVKAGFPSGAEVGQASQTGSGHKPFSDISEVARIAIWNEFGVPKKDGTGWITPPRPFFRNALENKKPIEDFMDRVAADYLVGKYKTPEDALEAVGLFIQDRIKMSILEGEYAPNAPRTIEEKGSSKPLIDTSQMINSVTFTKHVGESAHVEKESAVL